MHIVKHLLLKRQPSVPVEKSEQLSRAKLP